MGGAVARRWVELRVQTMAEKVEVRVLMMGGAQKEKKVEEIILLFE